MVWIRKGQLSFRLEPLEVINPGLDFFGDEDYISYAFGSSTPNIEAIQKGTDFALKRLNYIGEKPETHIHTGWMSTANDREELDKYWDFQAGAYSTSTQAIQLSLPGIENMLCHNDLKLSIDEALTHVAAHETTHYVQDKRGLLNYEENVLENFDNSYDYNLQPTELQANLVGSSAIRHIYDNPLNLMGNWSTNDLNKEEINYLEDIIDESIDDINILDTQWIPERVWLGR
jgi:hypothetical protein